MLVYVYTYICMYVGVHVCVGVLRWVLSVYIYIYLYVRVRVAAFQIHSVRSGPVTGDPDPIWIRARCGPDT